MGTTIHIALVGNPNIGKSSLFNALTGMNQHVGNFPGVTVDKKSGTCNVAPGLNATIIDLPGTYSLYPRREDEWVAYRVLMHQDAEVRPDMVVLVADASNLKRNLLFASQIIDLKIPVVIGLTMMDLARKKDISIDVPELERELGVAIIPINPRKNKGIPLLKKAIEQTAKELYKAPVRDFINNEALAPQAVKEVKAGRVEFKVDKGGNVAVAVGKRSFQPQQLMENARAVIEAVAKARPAAVRGKFIASCSTAPGTLC